MGRVKIGTTVLPISVRDLVADELQQPKTKSTLGVGLGFRGSKLDYWRSYMCNGELC